MAPLKCANLKGGHIIISLLPTLKKRLSTELKKLRFSAKACNSKIWIYFQNFKPVCKLNESKKYI